MSADFVYDADTGEYINCDTGVVLNAHYFLNRDGTVSGVGNGKLICGAAIVRGDKYLVCVEQVSHNENAKRVVAHLGDHRDKHGITWSNSERLKR